MTGDERLSPAARVAIADGGNDVSVSAASVWEISIKAQAGKLDVPTDVVGDTQEQFRLLPISAAHAWAAGALPLHHRDPFDRMLVAQARAEGLTIATRDPRFDPYDVPLLAA